MKELKLAINDELYEKVRNEGDLRGVDMNNVIAEAVEWYLDKDRKKENENMKETLMKIRKLSQKAYSQIDNSLYKSSLGDIERGIALGLDDLVDIQILLAITILSL